MDTAVALVQAYLQINGYFAVVEYPVLFTLPTASSSFVIVIPQTGSRTADGAGLSDAGRDFPARSMRLLRVLTGIGVELRFAAF